MAAAPTGVTQAATVPVLVPYELASSENRTVGAGRQGVGSDDRRVAPVPGHVSNLVSDRRPAVGPGGATCTTSPVVRPSTTTTPYLRKRTMGPRPRPLPGGPHAQANHHGRTHRHLVHHGGRHGLRGDAVGGPRPSPHVVIPAGARSGNGTTATSVDDRPPGVPTTTGNDATDNRTTDRTGTTGTTRTGGTAGAGADDRCGCRRPGPGALGHGRRREPRRQRRSRRHHRSHIARPRDDPDGHHRARRPRPPRRAGRGWRESSSTRAAFGSSGAPPAAATRMAASSSSGPASLTRSPTPRRRGRPGCAGGPRTT